MEVKSTGKFILICPRKVRIVANEIRGYSYPEAMDILRYIPRKGAVLLKKVLKSAMANVGPEKEKIKEADFFIKKVYIDKGPVLKRFRPRARGRGVSIIKRTSHITIVLADT